MSDVIITLIAFNETYDKDGYLVKERKESNVFGKLKSVRSTEFYQALQSGVKVQKVATIYVNEYYEASFNGNLPTFAEIEGFSYRIVREYQTSEDTTELTLSMEVHSNDK